MIQMIKNPYQNVFFEMISSSYNEISLCAPFVKTDIIKKVLESKKEGVKLSLITNSNLGAFASKGSDLMAIKTLLKNGIKVYNYQNLHAKIYIFDQEKALITSANLTHSGLVSNYEYGILIKDDSEAVYSIVCDYHNMIKSELCGTFNKSNINYIEKMIASLGSKPKLILDYDGDIVLTYNDVLELAKELNVWQTEVLEIILKLSGGFFTNKQLLEYIPYLQKIHPYSKTPDRTLSRVLQELRDRGLIKFIDKGKYKKLWE